MRGARMPVARTEAINFAREWASREGRRRTIYYHLSYPNGGAVPILHDTLLRPLRDQDIPTQYDCVGAVCAILGIDRVQGPPWHLYFDKKLGYGYMNCDTIIQDAQGDKINFHEVKGKDVRVGDLVVFGQRKVLGVRVPGTHGHIGILTGGAQVVHCSPSNARKLGHALAETGPEVFYNRKDRIYVRYNHFVGEQ